MDVVGGTLVMYLIEKPQPLLCKGSGIHINLTSLREQVGQQLFLLRRVEVVAGSIRHGFQNLPMLLLCLFVGAEKLTARVGASNGPSPGGPALSDTVKTNGKRDIGSSANRTSRPGCVVRHRLQGRRCNSDAECSNFVCSLQDIIF